MIDLCIVIMWISYDIFLLMVDIVYLMVVFIVVLLFVKSEC